MKNNYQQQIDQIMDNFDFRAVHEAMVKLNWEWAGSNMEMKVPDKSDLRKSARTHLHEVAFNKMFVAGSGGFIAMRIGTNLRLAFEIAEWYYEP